MSLKIDQATYSLYCNMPDQLIAFSIVNYFLNGLTVTNKFVNIFGNNIYDFKRTDLDSIATPAICIYPMPAEKDGDYGYLTGKIRAEFTLPAVINRARITESSMSIYNAYTFLLRTNDFAAYLCEAVPGLREFDWRTQYNMDDIYQNKQRSDYKFHIDTNYMVDLLAYYWYLNVNGLDVTDPCEQAGIVNEYFLTINDNPS